MTAESNLGELEDFYADIKTVSNQFKSRDIIVLMGDLNAKIGEDRQNYIVENYGLGERNERRDRLADFCRENNQCIINKFFKPPKRGLYTWKFPTDSSDNIRQQTNPYGLRSKEYVEELFNVKRSGLEIKEAMTGPEITLDEVERANTRKAIGPDEIPNEIIKHDKDKNHGQQQNANAARNYHSLWRLTSPILVVN
ncbi:hypothetical protein ILUMI_22538 [Ignelater luminosus]|uniref:Craniofacial development protein 2-like n=1 Tax=Ignelater luminosus TaxID=2038154 RepID=A0A8K0CGX5_IGNLU|nr:hypothetical protein ILUMI_22538 [Ignelater luminosus]